VGLISGLDIFGAEKNLLPLPGIKSQFLGHPAHTLVTILACCPSSLKVKVKFSLEQAMKAQRGSRGIALLFL
jgi:hypothetical protein